MAVNRRLFYGCKAAGVAPFEGTPTDYEAIRGLQSIGINTAFNLEQIFEIGQLELYELVENLPDVEVTMEKCLDGYPLIGHLLTKDAVSASLVGRSNQRGNIAMSIHQDTNETASGNQLSECIMSGVYLSQWGFDFQVEGPFRESVTAVGNNKVWQTGSFIFDGFTAGNGVSSLSPAAPEGVNFRQDLLMPSCLWPTEIPGISSSGTNDPVGSSGLFGAAIQSVRVSTNLGRQQLLELGRRGPYFRYVEFPVEVTCAIEINAKTGDLISATEEGTQGDGNNIVDQTIYVQAKEGTRITLGDKNKLASVTFGGGNAGQGGGNDTVTYNYTTFNTMTVEHPADPTVALRP